MNYVFGDDSTKIYYVIALVFVFLGTITSNDLVWELQDMFDQLLVIPNVLALFVLSKLVVREVKAANKRRKSLLTKTVVKVKKVVKKKKKVF